VYLLTYASDESRISFHEHAYNLGEGELYRGLMQKIHAVQLFADGKSPDSLICFVDGYDVALQGYAAAIEAQYLQMKVKGVLMSAEANCFPYPYKESAYPPCDTPFRFVNSGCYIGRAGELCKLFDMMRVDRIPAEVNDQAIFTDYYLANPDAFTLDTNCQLFQSLFGAWQYMEAQEDGYHNTLTGTRPLVLHGNGGAGLLKE